MGLELSHPGGALVAAAVGLVLGSFVSALTWRLPRGEAMAMDRSRCPECRSILAPRDLVPLLSWIFALGRCRRCGHPVSSRYPIIEAVTAGLCAAAVLRTGDLPSAAALGLLFVALTALAVVDLEHGYLPDVLQAAAAVPAAAVAFLRGGVEGLALGVVAAAVAGGAALVLRAGFRRLAGRDGLGLGDVKFFALAGLVLPPAAWPVFLMIAGGLGTLLGLLWRAAGRGPRFPFGPALVAGLAAVLLFPAFGP